MALSTERAYASLPSAISAPRWKFDVFLSFRGIDTRKGFVSHLYAKLQQQKGLTTFMDDRELEAGTSISRELPSAIKESHIAVVVFSPNYASSKWCLDELTHIVQCMEARDSILPIFYEVDPSHVRNQNGSFADAFAEYEEKLISNEDKGKLKQWKTDLRKVANLCGWDSKKYNREDELIEEIAKSVLRKVKPTMKVLSDSSRKLVGIEVALKELNLLLDHDANDVRFIGITGMGGIGKTTLAECWFDQISHRFEVPCFLKNVREVSARDGTLVQLQKKLLSPILKEKCAEVWDEQDGVMFAKKCLSNKKVFFVLDDVDQLRQLANLAGNKDWFGMGSRIIITTRNERLLVEHDITMSYRMEGLDHGDALELFSQNAFRKNQPEEDFSELLERFLHYAKGLPLALKTLGCSLYTRGRDKWKSVLDNLKKIPNQTIFDSLKISYDALEEPEKLIFLDVACFYKGKRMKEVIEMLDSTRDISSCILIDCLIEKSLFTIEESVNTIGMHDLVQELAWEIVRRESEEPGRRSRLMLQNDISHVFMNNTGSKEVEAIVLQLPKLEKVHNWNCKSLSKMQNLRILVLDNVSISSTPTFLPYSLRIMHWSWYPSKFLPLSFQSDSLIELRMPHSNLVRFWDGTKKFPNLKILDASFSFELTNTPDFSGLPNLEILSLSSCMKLVEIHPSIAFVKGLKALKLDDCRSIESLPSEVEMDSLEYFSLDKCAKLKKIPEFGPQMRNLSELRLCGTAIEKIPTSIENLVGLTKLNLSYCRSLVSLPSAICNSKSLKLLDINGCSKVKKIPEFGKHMRNLLFLDLSGIGIEKIPSSIENLVGLKYLRVNYCKSLVGLPSGIFKLKYLERLIMNGCSKVDKLLGGMECVESLCLSNTSLREPLVVMKNLKRLSISGAPVGEPPHPGLGNCILKEGDIPDDFGRNLSSLEYLDLGGTNFVNLPGSIRFLSKLEYLGLNGCTRLQQLPDLGLSNGRRLHLEVNNCTSLKRLSDLSEHSNRSPNLLDFTFRAVNCIRLVQDEAWNHALLSWGSSVDNNWNQGCVFPGNEIPEWFSNQSVGCSINMGPPPESSTNCLGIAFCLVFASPGHQIFVQSEFCHYYLNVIGGTVSDHLWVFYMPRQLLWDVPQSVLSFETSENMNCVKKCGARVVYKQDLEELSTTMNILR